jgi:coenzyme F420 biosynthesis associated uncharacterized protein
MQPGRAYCRTMAMIDWDAAAGVGTRLVSEGPEVSAAEALETVTDLVDCAAASVEPVREATQLVSDPAEHRTEVVDRPEWIRSNINSFRLMVEPLESRMAARGSGDSAAATIGGKASALQIGGVLSWIATKVLGQYEAVTPPGQPGRLMLVAPNILAAERQLQVNPHDFRMWVCLHEETHRVQFGAVPWLADHFRAEVDAFLSGVDLDNSESLKRVGAILVAVLKVLGGASGASIVDAAQAPAQREVFDRLTALMTLLEGHAEFVMDTAAPAEIPTLDQIRSRFDQRRSNPGAVDGLLRRLMGMDVKLQQYTSGRTFVAGVVDEVGIDGFNKVWTSPNTLPTRAEITSPMQWCERVC